MNSRLVVSCAVRLAAMLLVAAMVPSRVAAQDQQDCKQRLEQASNLFAESQFSQVRSVLRDCLQSDQLNEDERIEANKLVATAAIVDDLEDEARSAIMQIIELVPSYAPDPANDADLFIRFFERVKNSIAPPIQQLTVQVSPDSLVLSWSVVDNGNVEYYRIDRGEQVHNLVPYGRSLPGHLTYVDQNVGSGRTYYYRVTAIGVNGTSGEPSTTVEGTLPKAAELPLQPVSALPVEKSRRISKRAWLFMTGGAVVASGTAVALLCCDGGKTGPLPLPPGYPN